MQRIKGMRVPLAAVLLLVSNFSLIASASPQGQHAGHYSPDLKTCLDGTGASIIYPDSNGYNTTAKSQNTNYDYQPAAIAKPRNASEVAKVVKCVAARHGTTKLSSFGGGHGYASYALGGADGFVIIDSKNIKDVQVDSSRKTAVVGMGMTLGPLATIIGQHGFALPHGTCSSVGVFGHALGGGWGFSSRKWGWLMDHIVALTFVGPAGHIRTLSPSSKGPDSDLWWAMRGAGANNFGVVTSLTLQLEDAPAKSVNYRNTFSSNAECALALIGLQQLGLKEVEDGGLPAELGAQLLLYGENTGNPGACSFSGQYLGPIEGFKATEDIIANTFSTLGVRYQKANATEFSDWVATLTDLMGDLSAPPNKVPYYAQSLLDDGRPGYNNESVQGIVKAVQEAVGVQETGTSISFDLNGPVAGTNGVQPHGDSAFAVAGHRKSLFLNQIYTYGYPAFTMPQAQADVNAVVDGVTNSVIAAKPDAEWRAYVNYVDPRLQDWARMYYGDALGRLKHIKHRIDPTTIFDFPQGLAHA